ncbi:hypothetical protein Poli38472_006579 [Pythium oligandrum]|uniref:Pre-mRNA-splicing factor SYF2 n=1 Tax=Pythium oligandrum TaxID=41045 RepID=A0A8K1C515_PYTOL|nr:hypothetical protein Poli38472_006579 [Pythium oligandrum]|eukprot:TMW56569.1 hypothetical protein Poli38472_006579 [Pythium oligandrum]
MADTDDNIAAMTPAQRKLFELRMKVNAGRKANKQEVAAEHERLNNGDKKAKKEQQYKKREEQKAIKASGKAHLEETADVAQYKAKKDDQKAKRKAAFGWDAFNQDSLFKAYKKRLTHLPTEAQAKSETGTEQAITTLEDELSYGKSDNVEQEGLNRMAKELEDRIKARKTFSRRRQHRDGEDVDYINDQNRMFNRKAGQAYDKYTVEIRQNLERGTAL